MITPDVNPSVVVNITAPAIAITRMIAGCATGLGIIVIAAYLNLKDDDNWIVAWLLAAIALVVIGYSLGGDELLRRMNL